MEKLTKRELSILEFIKKNKQAGNAEMADYLKSISIEASRITVIRSINAPRGSRLTRQALIN